MSALVPSRRVSILLQVADSIAKRSQVDPVRDAVPIARSWARATPTQFRQLAIIAGMKPPDDAVFRLFVEALQGRADRVAGELSGGAAP
jgi:hypothetical protein